MLLFAFTAQSQEDRYSIKNLNINNEYSNFGTTFYGDEQVVYASPEKKSYIIRNVWKGNNQPFLDLFIGNISEDGQLTNIANFSESINSRYHESDVAFTKDKKTVYFSRNNYLNKKLKKDSTGIALIHLFKAKVNNKGEWIDIEPMPFNNDEYQTGHPTLSADEKTLYFISDMPGSIGKTDVFKAAINEDGSIGNPINLGPEINTVEKEMFASISGNDELYFSSDGRADGLGGLDIYVSKIYKDRITPPKNLGVPMNSDKDDFSFILNYETRRGYFSSNRSGGKGDDDIYTFIQNIPIEFECKQEVKGQITEKYSGELLPGSLIVLFDEEGTELNKMVVENDGLFKFEIDCNKSYKIVGSKEGYISNTAEFYATEGEELEIPLTLILDAFKVDGGNCVVKINPIFFDFDKSDIREDAEFELAKVVLVMKKYPEIIIEGGSHTDSRGTALYNKFLSAKRAESTVKYIISKGISPDRVSSKGYGESQLLNGCSNGVKCTEEEHQLNRRTEFIIVNYNDIKKKYPEICPTEAVFIKKDLELKMTDKTSIIETNIKKEVGVKEDIKNEEPLNVEFKKDTDKIIIQTNPIYFDLNSSYLNSEAIRELYKVVKIMKKYPDLIVECGSHTDSRANEKYNQWLSDRRAKRSIEYIISKGINPNRISSKGFGEALLVNKCSDNVNCSDAEHKLNRRTEFVIQNPKVLGQL